MTATRELRGAVMDLRECGAGLMSVRFAGQIISHTVKGADGLTAFRRAFAQEFVPGSEEEEYSDHGQVLGRYHLGHQRGL